MAIVPRPLPIAADALLRENPRLALVEVDEVPNELCAFAASGLLSLTGRPGEEPVVLGGHAALAAIGVYVAIAAATCLIATRASGKGTRVEVSGRNCLEGLLEQAACNFHATGKVMTRRGFRGAVSAVSGAFPCADGYWMLSLGAAGNWARFMEWVNDPVLLADPRLAEEDERQRKRDFILDRLGAWSLGGTKEQLVSEAQARHIPSSPVSTTSDLADDPQLIARGYLRKTIHPEFGEINVPAGAIATAGKNDMRFAPRLGEHTAAIFAEAGIA
jgi:crotonobetainyl-CoA:carnitine CoA-transferase CaiB-like acyl-CoA transferase